MKISSFSIRSWVAIGFILLLLTLGCSDSPVDGTDEGDGGDDSGDGTDPDGETDTDPANPYFIGVGRHDVTGPCAEVMFAGYCDFGQTGQGIYMRTWARAFIVADDSNRVVLVSADIPQISSGVHLAVIKRLKETFGDLYTEKNVMLSATHNHSAPGGFFRTYLMNIFAGMGFSQANFDIIVEGMVLAITEAHETLAPGRLLLGSADASAEVGQRLNRNRSPEAYELNYDVNDYLLDNGELDATNRTITQLKFIREDDTEIGAYHFLPHHPNMAGSHLFLVNGDVNGYAAYLMERERGVDYSGETTYVAAFDYNAASDTSGNLPEDVEHFSALYPDETIELNENGDWIADGTHDYERIARRTDTVLEIVERIEAGPMTPLTGAVDARQMFVPFPKFPIDGLFIDERDIYYEDILDESIDTCRLCAGAAGASFLAGSTEDGDSGIVTPEGNARTDMTDYSTIDFDSLNNGVIPTIAALLLEVLLNEDVKREEMDCQTEKMIAVSIDEANTLFPGEKPWNLKQPVQIIKLGQVGIIALPVEVATMSGRRLRQTLLSAMPGLDYAVVSSLANGAGQYLTTRQEYASQQYEGGSTLLGPYELNAVTQMVHQLAASFQPGVDIPAYAVSIEEVEEGLEADATLTTGTVIHDGKPLGTEFGDVWKEDDAAESYPISTDPLLPTIVTASFVGAHPNNSVGKLESFLEIHRIEETASIIVSRDWDPQTRYIWKREGTEHSKTTVQWHVPADTPPGVYQILHRGHWKEPSIISPGNGEIHAYEGKSRQFRLEPEKK